MLSIRFEDIYKFTDSPYDTALVLVVALHVEVAVVSNCEDVWWHLTDLFVGVQAYLLR